MIEFLLVHWDCKELVPNVAHRSKVWSQQMSPEHPALPPKAISAEKYTILKYQGGLEMCRHDTHINISLLMEIQYPVWRESIAQQTSSFNLFSKYGLAFSGGLCTGTRFECLWSIKFHMPYNMDSCGHTHTRLSFELWWPGRGRNVCHLGTSNSSVVVFTFIFCLMCDSNKNVF